jgi:hypothetical protein
MYYGKFLQKFVLLASGLLIIIFFAGWILINSGQNSSKKNYENKTEGEKTAEEVYKNIKEFKGMPASQLGPTMDFFEAALGFNCGNCHVRDQSKGWEFDKDDKPEKRKARDMIEMMNAMNKNNFKGEQLVTCYTCHRGSPDPQTIPAVLTSLNKQAGKEIGNDDESIKVHNRMNTAGEIIAKYTQAAGGKEAIEKITSLKMEGTVIGGRVQESTVSILQKAPGYYFCAINSPQGSLEWRYNGEEGWFKTPQYTRKMEGNDLLDLKLSSDFYNQLDFENNYSGLKLSDVERLDNDTVYVVEGSSSKYRHYKFFFSTSSGLLVRQIQYNQTWTGELQIQTDYKDYRSVNGVMLPYEIHTVDFERNQVFKYNNITANVAVDDNIFSLPGK